MFDITFTTIQRDNDNALYSEVWQYELLDTTYFEPKAFTRTRCRIVWSIGIKPKVRTDTYCYCHIY